MLLYSYMDHNSVNFDKLPPPAIVAFINESSSSSPLIASCKCLGVIRFTFRSLLQLPANSNT